jgi:V8-like Glu-specific endopeptidase
MSGIPALAIASAVPQFEPVHKQVTVVGLDSRDLTETSKDARAAIDRTAPAFRQLNAVGIVKNVNHTYDGTGFLLEKPCIVATNAHVVFEDRHKPLEGVRVEFSVGKGSSVDEPFLYRRLPGTVFAHGDPFEDSTSENGDWALVKLDASIPPGIVAPLEMYQMPTSQLVTLRVESVGFPSDRAWKGNHYDLSQLYGDMNCRVLDEEIGDDEVLIHNCNSTPGNSGSPLLTMDTRMRFYVVGMNIGHSHNGLQHTIDPGNANLAVGFYKQGKNGWAQGDGVPLTDANNNTHTEGNKIRSAIDSIKCP